MSALPGHQPHARVRRLIFMLMLTEIKTSVTLFQKKLTPKKHVRGHKDASQSLVATGVVGI